MCMNLFFNLSPETLSISCSNVYFQLIVYQCLSVHFIKLFFASCTFVFSSFPHFLSSTFPRAEHKREQFCYRTKDFSRMPCLCVCGVVQGGREGQWMHAGRQVDYTCKKMYGVRNRLLFRKCTVKLLKRFKRLLFSNSLRTFFLLRRIINIYIILMRCLQIQNLLISVLLL